MIIMSYYIIHYCLLSILPFLDISLYINIKVNRKSENIYTRNMHYRLQFNISSIIYTSSSSGHSLEIGRTIVLVPIFNFTTRTCPSLPGKTSTMRPSGQLPRGSFWFITMTTSPSFKSFCWMYPFFASV